MADRHNILAARALLNARQLAREFAHGWIGSEHLLLGLFNLEAHPVRDLLLAHGVCGESLTREVSSLAPSVLQPRKARLPLSSSLQETLEAAAELTESRRLMAINVEHLLLALLRTRAGLGFALLVKQGVDVGDLERELQAMIDARQREQSGFGFGA